MAKEELRVGAEEALEAFAPARHREWRAALRAWLAGGGEAFPPEVKRGLGPADQAREREHLQRQRRERRDWWRLREQLRAEAGGLDAAVGRLYDVLLDAYDLELQWREVDRFAALRRDRRLWPISAWRERAPGVSFEEVPATDPELEGRREELEGRFGIVRIRARRTWTYSEADQRPGGDLDPNTGPRERDPLLDGRLRMMRHLVDKLGIRIAPASRITAELLRRFARFEVGATAGATEKAWRSHLVAMREEAEEAARRSTGSENPE